MTTTRFSSEILHAATEPTSPQTNTGIISEVAGLLSTIAHDMRVVAAADLEKFAADHNQPSSTGKHPIPTI